jgi:multidrug efflux pump subunit AcrA (membrane-fusion protein)
MRLVLLAAFIAASGPAFAETIKVEPQQIVEWKAVYGRVEARDTIAARARIGGIVVELSVSEGDEVKAGQKIATIRDDKIAFQIDALDAQIASFQAQLATARDELERGKALVAKGVSTAQRLDQLKTLVDVAQSQMDATKAQRSIVVQQGAEGEVLAPGDGRILTVPVTKNAVIMAGEPVATIGGGGFFLRLAIPERHASLLKKDAAIRIASTRAFITSPLTPLFLLAAFAFGLVALITLPREEEPQISVPMVDILVRADGLKAEDAAKLSPNRSKPSSRALTASSMSIRRPATTASWSRRALSSAPRRMPRSCACMTRSAPTCRPHSGRHSRTADRRPRHR